jgi:hypothetical protein
MTDFLAVKVVLKFSSEFPLFMTEGFECVRQVNKVG